MNPSKMGIQLLSLFFLVYVSILCAKTNNELFENKNILIFGGTGYLGRALTTELLRYNPKKSCHF